MSMTYQNFGSALVALLALLLAGRDGGSAGAITGGTYDV
jgi:hypothetical protein